jgi:putative transposase
MTNNSTITPELLDQLLANYEKPEDLTGADGLFKQLKKALIERALGAELSEHLGYEKGDPAGRGSGNSRNGTSAKTVLTDDGEIDIAVPRDRAGSFEPLLIAKGQTRFDGFDEKILSLYARGMTVREIQGHLAELYGTEVSPDLISRVTDAVLDEVREWQTRPLDPVYPVVFFDALRVKIRDEGMVKNKAVYVALALNPDGEKEVLGLWIEQTEGAKFWLKVINELKTRGLNDILIAVVDGLKGFPEAIASVYSDNPDELRRAADAVLRAAGFAPEVLSRIDRIFVFEPLSGLDIARVAALEIESMIQGYGLEISAGGINPQILLDPLPEGYLHRRLLRGSGGAARQGCCRVVGIRHRPAEGRLA